MIENEILKRTNIFLPKNASRSQFSTFRKFKNEHVKQTDAHYHVNNLNKFQNLSFKKNHFDVQIWTLLKTEKVRS